MWYSRSKFSKFTNTVKKDAKLDVGIHPVSQKLKKLALRRLFLVHNTIYPLKKTEWQRSRVNISLNTNWIRMILEATNIYLRLYNDM